MARLATLLPFVLAVLLATSAARAKPLMHGDLATLAFSSDAIVLARKTGERPLDPYEKVTEHVVVKAYAGGLGPGDTVDVPYYGPYRFEPMFGWPAADAGPHAMSDLVVLFLVKHDDPAAGTSYELAASGLRIFIDGKTFRFEQHENPGPYEPVAQGRDPFDVLGDPRGGDAVDVATFEHDLAAAIDRARAARAALDLAPSPERTAKLLDIVGPPPDVDDDSPVAPEMVPGFYADRLVATVLDALSVDPSVFAAGMARVRGGVSPYMMGTTPADDDLLAVARNASLAPTTRAAAVDVVVARWFGPKAAPSLVSPLLSLATDSDADVRLAALGARFGEDAPKEVGAALAADFQTETDARARFRIVSRLSALRLAASLPRAGFPVVYAYRRRRLVDVGWIDVGTTWHPAAAELVATRGAESRRLRLPMASLTTWSSAEEGGRWGYLLFDPPLEPARWDISVHFVLSSQPERSDGTSDPRELKSPSAERTFDIALAPLDLTPRVSLPPPSAAAAPSSSIAAVAPPSTHARACGCETAGVRGGEGPAALAFSLAWLARRRRR